MQRHAHSMRFESQDSKLDGRIACLVAVLAASLNLLVYC